MPPTSHFQSKNIEKKMPNEVPKLLQNCTNANKKQTKKTMNFFMDFGSILGAKMDP
jgi:hypothetical protein